MSGWAGGLLNAEGARRMLAPAAGQPEVCRFDNVAVLLPGEMASGRALPDGEREEQGRRVTTEAKHQFAR